MWLLLLTSRTMAIADPPVDRAPDITVFAHQWWWEVRYPSGAITANEIHIPVGKALVVRLESADVVHDFWVPALGRKIDVIPGRPANVWLQADEPGDYLGTCAEYCGAQHAWMRIRVVAEAPEQFADWEQHQLAARPRRPRRPPRGAGGHSPPRPACSATPSGASGRRRSGRTSRTSPSGRRWALASSTTRRRARPLAEGPTADQAGCHMPNAQLSDGEVADLVAYFETLR